MSRLSGIKVLLGPSTFGVSDPAPLEKLAAAGCHIINNPYKRKIKKNELLELLAGDVSGLIAGLERLDHEVMSQSQLKVISRCGTGLSNVDLEAAKKLGIRICNTPDAPTNAVAELTLGGLLGLLRCIPQMDKDLHGGEWNKQTGYELKGKKIAIIGFGRIGRRVAELLEPFGGDIVVVDPFLKTSDELWPLVTLEEALTTADIMTFHCSGEQCILGEKEFSLMKKGTFLLNASRGGLISESALEKALTDGTVKGAWLDTFIQEPYVGGLTKFPNVILTPHVGSYTVETRALMEMEAVDNLIRAFDKVGSNV